jgi:hypothetical protein
VLDFQQSFVEQLRNVIGAVRDRQPPYVSGREGLRSLRLIEECYRRRKLMPMPWLSREEMMQAQRLAAQTGP